MIGAVHIGRKQTAGTGSPFMRSLYRWPTMPTYGLALLTAASMAGCRSGPSRPCPLLAEAEKTRPKGDRKSVG